MFKQQDRIAWPEKSPQQVEREVTAKPGRVAITAAFFHHPFGISRGRGGCGHHGVVSAAGCDRPLPSRPNFAERGLTTDRPVCDRPVPLRFEPLRYYRYDAFVD